MDIYTKTCSLYNATQLKPTQAEHCFPFSGYIISVVLYQRVWVAIYPASVWALCKKDAFFHGLYMRSLLE